MIKFEDVASRYSYDPETGDITNLKLRRVIKSTERNNGNLYRYVSVMGRRIRAHRIAWLLHYGSWPSGQIDHDDNNGLNNRISNLKDVSHIQNQRNQRTRADSSSGVKGVCLHKPTGRWQALIWVSGKRIFLGRFDTVHDAAAARSSAEAKYWS